MPRPLFQLGPRLQTCADMVRDCGCLGDIGTDHALLPVWLLKKGRIKRAIASDIREGPLQSAMENAGRYRVQPLLETRISNGLSGFEADEVDEIVIAGMGGELILEIINAAMWLKSPGKHLVLQPMSMERELRLGLRSMGFEIAEERAVEDAGRIYSVMSVEYTGVSGELSITEEYIGKLKAGEKASTDYAEKVTGKLRKKAEGLRAGGKENESQRLFQAVLEIQKEFDIV